MYSRNLALETLSPEKLDSSITSGEYHVRPTPNPIYS